MNYRILNYKITWGKQHVGYCSNGTFQSRRLIEGSIWEVIAIIQV